MINILCNRKYIIKIDHHPFIEKYCDLEIIDDKASSASQVIIEFALKCNLKIPYSAASKLYMGVVGDTERFLHNYTTTKTFDLVSALIKKTNLDFTSLYEQMYLRSFNDVKFSAYITNNMIIFYLLRQVLSTFQRWATLYPNCKADFLF